MVLLLLGINLSNTNQPTNLHSNMVLLLRKIYLEYLEGLSNLHSNMVLLLPDTTKTIKIKSIEFTFQYGATSTKLKN